MRNYDLVPQDIDNVLASQNLESPTGSLGAESTNTYQYVLKYRRRYSDIADFNNLVIKSTADGRILRLKNVAKIELGTVAFAILTMTTIMAKNEQKQVLNPWGLVYDGALTENVVGKVNIHPVRYDVSGIAASANVYTPANYDPNKKYAAVVVAHPNGGVKEHIQTYYVPEYVEQERAKLVDFFNKKL